MSAFDLDLTNSENSVGDSNIQAFTSPKISEKDLSAIYANSGDRSFKLSSPIPMSGEYKLSYLGSCDRLSALNDSSILQDSNTSELVQEEEEDATEAPEATSEETAQQRMEREERESQELAWQLMQEENQEMYNMQMQFMRENADQMSEEDLALIQAMINESAQPQQGLPAVGTIGADDEGEAEEGDELNESDSSNWDYERLLQLGQQIGDVKTERWRMRAKSVITSLPRQIYSELMPQHSTITTARPVTVFTTAVLSSPTAEPAEPAERDERSSSNKKQCVRATDCGCDTASATSSVAQEVQTERCVVCMDDFEAQDELVVLPCRHYFHIPCTEGWLADHNFCPSCKTKVSATPEK